MPIKTQGFIRGFESHLGQLEVPSKNPYETILFSLGDGYIRAYGLTGLPYGLTRPSYGLTVSSYWLMGLRADTLWAYELVGAYHISVTFPETLIKSVKNLHACTNKKNGGSMIHVRETAPFYFPFFLE